MSENAIVPYRVTDLSTIQPIDLTLIPNENWAEQTRIRELADVIWSQLYGLRSARAKRAAKRVFLWFSVPVLMLLLASVLMGIVGIGNAVCIALAACLPIAIAAFVAHDIELPPSSNVQELRQRLEAMELRMSKLKSLDRLTGTNDEAKRLLDEARTFNKDIANLEAETCTRKDLRLIEEKRSAILSHIADFREKVVETGTDDRA